MDPRIRIRIHTKMSWIRNTVKDIARLNITGAVTVYLGHSSGELAGHVGEGGGDHESVAHGVHYPDPNHVSENWFLFGL